MPNDLDKILLGEDAIKFLESSIGKSLVRTSEEYKTKVVDEILELDPFAFCSLAELQSKISEMQFNYKRTSTIAGYLKDFIVEGINTLDIVHQNQEDQE